MECQDGEAGHCADAESAESTDGFDQAKNGWYFTKPVPFFPSLPLTEKETVGLFIAQKSIEQFKGTALEPVLEGAFRKMMAGLDDSVKYSLSRKKAQKDTKELSRGEANKCRGYYKHGIDRFANHGHAFH